MKYTQKNINYIIEKWIPVRGTRMLRPTMDIYLETERILLDAEKPRIIGCTCNSTYLVRQVEFLYKKHESEIKRRYDEYRIKKVPKVPKPKTKK